MKYLYSFLIFFIFLLSNAQSDCTDAITVCGNTGYVGLTTSGIGSVQELTTVNSCGFGETNSIWLRISINTGGTLGFILTPTSPDIVEDFDFYLFGPNPSCGTLGNTIRCSTTNPEAAGSESNITGMNNTETDFSEGPGPDGNNFVQSLVVASGDFYYLIIDRPFGFSDFSIQWSGTATFNDSPTINTPVGIALDLKLCDYDGTFDESTAFNLTQNTAIIRGNQANVTVTYHTSINDAVVGINSIVNTANFENTTNPQTIYVRLTNDFTDCFTTTSFEVKTNDNIILTTSEASICDTNQDGNDSNGKATFTVNQLTETYFEGIDISSFNIKYYLTNNDAINNTNELIGSFSNTISNLQSIFVKIINVDNCEIILEVTLKVNQLPLANNQFLEKCVGANSNGTSVFDLNNATVLFTNSNANLSVSYFLNTTELNANNPLNNVFTNTTNPQNIIAKITDLTTDCFKAYTLTLSVNTTPGRIITPLEECELIVEEGLAIFDLTTANLNLLTNETATFYSSESDALLSINAITNAASYSNENPYLSSVYVKIDNGINCQGLSELQLIVNKLPELENSNAQICNNIPIILYVTPIYSFYEWENNATATSNQIQVSQAGDYKVTVTDAKGCKNSKTFSVLASEKATITSLQIDDFNGQNNTVLIEYEGIGDYEFSLDGLVYQDNNYFSNVPSGEYTIVIRDKNDCGVSYFDTYVLAYPTFFTPNNDGYNDTWKIKNIDLYPNSTIKIFDKYGKLLKNISANETGWNGKLVGENLPADDYWFILTLTNKKEIEGHFSLKR